MRAPRLVSRSLAPPPTVAAATAGGLWPERAAPSSPIGVTA